MEYNDCSVTETQRESEIHTERRKHTQAKINTDTFFLLTKRNGSLGLRFFSSILISSFFYEIFTFHSETKILPLALNPIDFSHLHLQFIRWSHAHILSFD